MWGMRYARQKLLQDSAPINPSPTPPEATQSEQFTLVLGRSLLPQRLCHEEPSTRGSKHHINIKISHSDSRA